MNIEITLLITKILRLCIIIYIIALFSLFINELYNNYKFILDKFIIFINLCALYYFFQNLHINITIRYGR